MNENTKIGLMMLTLSVLFFGMYLYINALPASAHDDNDIFREQLDIDIEYHTISEIEITNLNREVETQKVPDIEPVNNDIYVYTFNAIQKISLKEFEDMCRVVMNEVGGESYGCQVAVAETIINRVNSDKFPDSIASVLWQPYQFSHKDNGEITDSVREAVTQALEQRVFDKDMLYFNENDYFDFAENYFCVDGMYFSKGCDD